MKKHHRNSKHYKDKADRLWSLCVRLVGRCELCGKVGGYDKSGFPVKGLQAHHLIPRANLKYRWDYENGVCLCLSHHGAHPNYRNRRSCAHGSGEVYERFKKDLEICNPQKYQYWQEHKDDKLPPEPFTYQEVCEILSKDLEQLKRELGYA